MHYAQAKAILSPQNGMNLYRGCTHGCIYCDSRSLCYNMQHKFEDVEVKENAIELLEDALKRKKRKCMLGTGSMTDPYIPLENQLGYMQKSLELALRYGFGFTLITKSCLVLRDIELLREINRNTKCVVQMTLTTFDQKLCSKLEPNVSSTKERFEALKKLNQAGIPTVVWLCPILPFINDTPENISGILNYCAQAGVYGVICFGMGTTMRAGSREYFYKQLDRLFPGMKEKYIKAFQNNYHAVSPNNAALMKLFHAQCEEYGMAHDNRQIFEYISAFENCSSKNQLTFW